ncbi:MAG: TldD/PmbA family protein [Candidatus Asgardarchaeia archaeon]
MSELHELGEFILKKADELNISEVEVFISRIKNLSLDIRRNEIRENEVTSDVGVGIRVVVDRKLGFAYTNDLRKENLTIILEKAVSLARINKPDDNWHGFPSVEKSKYPNIPTSMLYDKKLDSLDSDILLDLTKRLLESAVNFDKRISFAFGSVGIGSEERLILNTNGIDVKEKDTYSVALAGVIARSGSVVTPIVFDYSVSRQLNLNPEEIGELVSERAVKSLNAKTIPSGNYDVIFTQDALHQIMRYTIVEAIKADNIHYSRSPLRGKLGQVVLNDELTMIDDGLYPQALGTERFDDEGYPSQKTTIFDKGTFVSPIYDHYTAKKDNRESTGNAKRKGSSIGASISYSLTPSIHTKNLVIRSGDASPDELISEVKDGILVWGVQGAHSSNPSTGEFSVAAVPAWKIENGEIVYPVRGILISGNIYSLLSKDLIVGNNVKIGFGYVFPWILTRNVSVAGK